MSHHKWSCFGSMGEEIPRVAKASSNCALTSSITLYTLEALVSIHTRKIPIASTDMLWFNSSVVCMCVLPRQWTCLTTCTTSSIECLSSQFWKKVCVCVCVCLCALWASMLVKFWISFPNQLFTCNNSYYLHMSNKLVRHKVFNSLPLFQEYALWPNTWSC